MADYVGLKAAVQMDRSARELWISSAVSASLF
jgi:hypothetical protein